MAEVDLTTQSKGSSHAGQRGIRVLETTLDFKSAPRASGDILNLFHVKNARVLNVMYRVERAEGGAATADVGDGSDPNGYLAAINLNSEGAEGDVDLALAEASPNTVAAYSGGKFYGATADTIDMVLGAAVDNAKVTVKAAVLDWS